MKLLNNIALVSCAAVCASATVNAAPLVTLGDDVELYVTGEAGLAVEDNVFLTEHYTESDSVMNIKPGIEVQLGKDGRTDMFAELVYQHDFLYFETNDELDDDYADLRLSAGYDSGKLRIDAQMSYKESATNEEALAGDVEDRLIYKEVIAFDSYADYVFSSKLSLGVGFGYSDKDFDLSQYADSETYEIPVDVYYELTSKMDLSLGYRIRNVVISDSDYEYNYLDNDFNVALHGELAPKLKGVARIGYQVRSTNDDARGDIDPDAGAESGISADINLQYLFDPKLTFDMGVARDYGVSAGNSSTTTYNEVRFGARYLIDPMWSVNSSASYRIVDYAGEGVDQEDDVTFLSVGGTYMPNEYLLVSANYNFLDNDSDTGRSYTNNKFNISASLRY